MKKTLTIMCIIGVLFSVVSFNAFANDEISSENEKITYETIIDDHFMLRPIIIENIPKGPTPEDLEEVRKQREAERLERLEKGPYVEVKFGDNMFEITPDHYPITVDVTKKIMAVVSESFSSSSNSESIEEKNLSVDMTGKIISMSDFVMNQETAEKIARIYRDLLDVERLKNSDDIYGRGAFYFKEEEIWVVAFVDEEACLEAIKALPDGYVATIKGMYSPVLIGIRNDGTVAGVFTNGPY